MDSRTALWALVGLAALLAAGILLFLFQAMKVLLRLEETSRALEKNAIPLLLNMRHITEEVEPLIKKTSERYRSLEEGLDSLSRSPVFSLLFPALGGRNGPFRVFGGLIRVLRGVVAGVSKAREVLHRPTAPPYDTTGPDRRDRTQEQETHHGK